MTYTTTPPKVAGYYLLKKDYGAVLMAEVSDGIASIGNWTGPVSKAGGLWCRLVSADALKEAYSEGFVDCIHHYTGDMGEGAVESNYQRSVTKTIAEGLEP